MQINRFAPRRTSLLAAAAVGVAILTGGQARADAASDRDQITATALDFEEGWYTADAERMARALHPNFRMRHVATDKATGASVLDQNVDRDQLVAWTRSGRGKVPPERQRHDVTVLDIFGDAATAKIRAWYGVDYLQLARWNGRWVIASVLWSRPGPKD